MKQLLFVLVLVAAALAAPSQFEPIQLNYHEEVGIPEAARIEAEEEAVDLEEPRIDDDLDLIYEPLELNYHEAIGIPKAALIKASEEATDFDGARIVGGTLARVGQFPSLGGLIITLANGGTSVCGSSMLTNTRLVTSAHCWFDGRQNARLFTVVLASIRLFSGGTRIDTNQVVIHPNYDRNTLANDIAVISIRHVAFNNNIRAINMATGSANFAGQTATAAGFGLTGQGAQITPNQGLYFVTLPVITNARCAQFFGNRMVIASTICTWGPVGRNICNSDSGGPLQIGNTLIGVTSFGPFSCVADAPAAYARVTSFVSWIRSRL